MLQRQHRITKKTVAISFKVEIRMIAINKLRSNYLFYKFKNIKYFIIIIVLIKMANVSSYKNI